MENSETGREFFSDQPGFVYLVGQRNSLKTPDSLGHLATVCLSLTSGTYSQQNVKEGQRERSPRRPHQVRQCIPVNLANGRQRQED